LRLILDFSCVTKTTLEQGILALRYAIKMRRQGRTRSECNGVGFGTVPFAGQRRDLSERQVARGLDFNLFATGGDY
jgi:hypothetical protein